MLSNNGVNNGLRAKNVMFKQVFSMECYRDSDLHSTSFYIYTLLEQIGRHLSLVGTFEYWGLVWYAADWADIVYSITEVSNHHTSARVTLPSPSPFKHHHPLTPCVLILTLLSLSSCHILCEVRLETQLEVVAPDDEARPKRLPIRFLRMLILLRVSSAISFTLLRRQELYSGVGVRVRPGR